MENTTQPLAKLYEALAKAQAIMEGAKKDSTNPFFKSRYADLTSIIEACRKPLSDNGLSIMQPFDYENGILFVYTILGHCSGESKTSKMPILNFEKLKPQELGSTITYYRRYLLQSMLAMSADDDDGEATMKDVREVAPKLNEEQVAEILQYTGDNDEKISKILNFYNAKTLQDIPSTNYNKIIAHLAKPKPAQRRISA